MTEFTFFWETESPFSQWHPSPFQNQNGVYFKTAEQYMMWAKAILFNDHQTAQKILKTHNPRDQKALGREVKGFDSDIWNTHKYAIVYQGNKLKFLQNSILLAALLHTQGTELVEASPYDPVWGIGLKADDPKAQNKNTWQGENLLGLVLTELREEIIKFMYGQ